MRILLLSVLLVSLSLSAQNPTPAQAKSPAPVLPLATKAKFQSIVIQSQKLQLQMDADEKDYVAKSKQQESLGKQTQDLTAETLKELKLDPKEYTIQLSADGDVILSKNPNTEKK